MLTDFLRLVDVEKGLGEVSAHLLGTDKWCIPTQGLSVDLVVGIFVMIACSTRLCSSRYVMSDGY